VGRAAAADRREEARRRGHREELLKFYEGKIAKWWMPDDVVFVDAIPLGATGKILKTKLRERRRLMLPWRWRCCRCSTA
jgi:acyl-CoA synthetase (AMP-forming)/AMP-acid ligase II